MRARKPELSATTTGPSRALWSFLFLAVMLAVWPAYFLSYPLPGFLAKGIGLLAVLFLVVAGATLGRLFRRAFLHGAHSEDAPVWDLLLGWGAVGTAILLLGWGVPGRLDSKLMGILAVLALIVFWRHRDAREWIGEARAVVGHVFGSGSTVSVMLSAAGFGTALISCFSPLTYYDTLVYHASLPAYYVMEGRVAAVPFNLYSHFPALIEMLFTLAAGAMPSADIVINLIGLVFSISACTIAVSWAREISGEAAGRWAAALWWTMPAVLLLSLGGYVDVPLAAYTAMTLRLLWLASRGGTGSPWALAGLSAGFAASVKYTGGMAVIWGGLFALLVRSASPNVWRRMAFFLAGATAAFGPWLLKNLIEVGNPVFPFLYDLFGARVGWSHETARAYFQMLTEYKAKSGLLAAVFLAPWRITTAASEFGGGFDVLGDFGWPVFLYATPFAALHLFSRRPARYVAAGALFFFVAWVASKPVLRFLLPMLPMAVALTAVLFAETTAKQRWFAWIMAPWIISNVCLYGVVLDVTKPFRVAIGLDDGASYLRRRLQPYGAIEFLNNSAGPAARVFVLGEQRLYHLSVPYVASNYFALSPLAEACNSAQSPDDVRRYLRSERISHLFINERELARLGGLARFGFDSRGAAQLGALLPSLSLLHETGGAKVFGLITEAS